MFARDFQQPFLTYIPYVLSEEKGIFLKKKLFCATVNDLGCVTERAEDGYFGKGTCLITHLQPDFS
jgi:hypothetical protein